MVCVMTTTKLWWMFLLNAFCLLYVLSLEFHQTIHVNNIYYGKIRQDQ